MITPHYADGPVTLYAGDCIDVMRELPDASVDAVVTDPPYGLEFMGKEWDSFGKGGGAVIHDPATERGGFQDGNGGNPYSRSRIEYGRVGVASMHAFQAWCEEWAAECLRVLKPGGHLLAFGGTRTFHRLTAGIEDAGFEIRDSIAWMYGSGFPKSRNLEGDWQGWGTALKPAFEPIVVARKPLGGPVSVRARVEHELRSRGVVEEIRWTNASASAAARPEPSQSSSSTRVPQAEATSAAPADGSATANDERRTGSSSGQSTQPGAQPTRTTSASTGDASATNSAPKSSTPTDPTASAAEKHTSSSSCSTTSTGAAMLTGSRTGARSTTSSNGSASHPATASFAGIATGLTGSQAHAHISRNPDGTFVWPDGLPEAVTAGGTVAANVLAHGTGALNIDANRIGIDATDPIHQAVWTHTASQTRPGTAGFVTSQTVGDKQPANVHQAGRWPANVILDESQAAALDAQTGTLTSGKMQPTHTTAARAVYGQNAADGYTTMETYGDAGGASRFFYTAKAAQDERPSVDGIAHPTVKPLDLMRWLVRLVTPKGGTVLEPFAGSGTTVEACVLEGFDCIAIEREATYLPLIEKRIRKPHHVGFDFGDWDGAA